MRVVAALALLVLAGWATDAAAACPCTDFYTGDAKPFIAEGIACDAATGRFFVAGVAARRIVTIQNGRAREFAHLPDDYSPPGIAVAGGSLWVTAVIPQGAGREGPSALIDFDLSGKVKGIDGLIRLADGSFLASHNGLAEPRVLRLVLSPDWSQGLSPDVLAENDAAIADPSLVTAGGSGAYVVGVSQWGSFGQDRQAPTKPLRPWRIIKLELNPLR